MRRLAFGTLLAIASACASGPVVRPTPPAAIVALPAQQAAPARLSSGEAVRFTTSPTPCVLVAQDAASGRQLWTRTPPACGAYGRSFMRWLVLPAGDGRSVFLQLLADETPTYLGTDRVDARSGETQATDVKQELYWYEDRVLWTALLPDGALQMFVERAAKAGGGYVLRTLDPRDLRLTATRLEAQRLPAP